MAARCNHSWLPGDPARWVGDPVDIITGAQFDIALDFSIAWSLPFEWRRYYNTARTAEFLPLGWGHTHSYDHRLKIDLDGFLYTEPTGAKHAFPYAIAGTVPSATKTGTLRKAGPQIYRVKVSGQPECEFAFADPLQPARLQRVYRGRKYQELRYGPDGRWIELAFEHEPPLRIDSDQYGRIVALVWLGIDNGRDRVLWQATYDNEGNLVTVVDPYRTTQTFSYDSSHHMIRRTDRRGFGFVASYDASGRCVQSACEDGVQEVRLRYLPAQKATVVTRADGGSWQYFYQPEGITQIVDPYAGVTRRMYAPDGRLKEEIGPAGEVVRKVIDEETWLMREPYLHKVGMCLPFGDPWFPPVRELMLPADPLDWEGYGATASRNDIRFPVRAAEWVRQLPPSVGNALRFAAKAEEATPVEVQPMRTDGPPPEKRIGDAGAPGTARYDAFGTLLSHTLPTGETARWQYDPNGNIAKYVDYAGSEWRYEYGSWNLRTKQIDPLGNASEFAYNLLEKPKLVTDPGGTLTAQAFDLKDRMTERGRHATIRDRFSYDPSDGLIAARTGDRGLRIALKLGQNRRPVEIAPAGEQIRHCKYDPTGRLLEVTTEEGSALTFTYGTLGDYTADLLDGVGVERRYEASVLTESVVFGKFSTQYTTDDERGQTVIVDPAGGRHTVQQLDVGVFIRRNANGNEEVSQYDWNGQCLAKIRFNRTKPQANWSRTYRYSPVGALLEAADSQRGTYAYEYDAAHRLVGATRPDHTSDTFQYDSAGNLLVAPGLKGAAYSQNRITAANGRKFEYNDRHNIIRESGGGAEREYEYNSEDRLIACRMRGSEVRLVYDALGRRIEKVSADGTTRFVWDGERLAAEISPLGLLRVYVYADAMALTPFAFIDYDSQDAEPSSGRRRYVYANQIGCPVLIVDDAGEVLWRADVQPYGRAQIEDGAKIEFNLRWPGHYYDPETGLHYNRHRYYSPELGRYIQVDPRDLDGGLNVYAYSNRPLDEVDVDGLAPCPQKPMVRAPKNNRAFNRAKKRAEQISDDLRAAIKDAVDNGEMHSLDASGTTLTTMVVLGKDGKYRVVVTGNRSMNGLPKGVREAMDGAPYRGYGDDAPPPVREGDPNYGHERDNPRTGDREPTTHRHAEQRGLRTVDCDDDAKGVAYIAPTRPCCEGCSSAIQSRGGNTNNVSDLGRQPAADGNDWWN